MPNNTDPVLENRSEIVFLYDASDCNPNGNPLSANNKPRVDETTGEAVVTDVRLKRYLRDQLDDDDYGIYIRNPSKAPYEDVPDRDGLFKHVTDTDESDLEEMEEGDAAEAFLSNATDVRYFGATCSFSSDFQDLLGDDFPGQFIGPVQFEHGRSMHTVATKTESKQLSTVVASGGDEEQGTFATDNRLEYALVKFHGVVNENAAESTGLTAEDVERLDTLCWRALKNQTLTRSKMGHQPRVYLRVEYGGDSYHSGSLDHGIELQTGEKTDTELRNITDCTLDVSDLLAELEQDSTHIAEVSVLVDDYVEFDLEGPVGPEAFYDKLRESVGDDKVNVVDIHDT